MKIFKTFALWLACNKGATAIEYSLIATGIALAVSLTVFYIGDDLNGMMDRLSGAFNPN